MRPPTWIAQHCAGFSVDALERKDHPFEREPVVLVRPPADKWNLLTPAEARAFAALLTRAAAWADREDVILIQVTPTDREFLGQVLDTCDPASDCGIGNDEIDRAREILAGLGGAS